MRGFGREILALAASIEFPTVIAATDTITLDPSISEARSTMRTTILHEPHMSVGTAIKGVVSAQNFYTPRLAGHEIGRAHVWTPVTNAHLVCRLLLENNKHQQYLH